MAWLRACIVALLALQASADKVTPAQQVVTMLQEMYVKGSSGMKVEEHIFADYMEWVKKTAADLTADIESGKGKIEKLTGFIEETDAKAAALGSAIAKIDGDIASLESDLKDATTTRAAQKAEFLKAEKDYSESIAAVQEAIMVLEKQSSDVPEAVEAMSVCSMQKMYAGLQTTSPACQQKLGSQLAGLQEGKMFPLSEACDCILEVKQEIALTFQNCKLFEGAGSSLYAAYKMCQTGNIPGEFGFLQASAVLQKMAGQRKGMARVLAALIQLKNQDDVTAPAAAAYEFQGGHIIDILKELGEKFKSELSDLSDVEMNQANQFAREELNLKTMLDKAEADRKEKASLKSKAVAASAEAQSTLAETRASLAEDEKTLQTTEVTYKIKSGQYEENQKVRSGELAAISQALEILKGVEVSAKYTKHLTLVQIPGKSIAAKLSFLQVRSRTAEAQSLARVKVAELLAKKAKVLSSTVLAQAASDVSGGPLDKVIKMIEDLLDKLKSDAAEEKSHKAWCDTELKKNKIKREKKASKVEITKAEIEDLAQQIAALKEESATLTEEQAQLTKAMSEATATRQKEKAANKATLADTGAALAAVGKAIVILKDFYGSQASLLQRNKQAPEMAAYKGMGGSSRGVVDMLETIEADFKRLDIETSTAESEAAEEYDDFMSKSKASKKAKAEQVFDNGIEVDKLEFDKSNTMKDLKAIEAEKAEADAYFEELKPQCVKIHVSYEERKAKRQEEIAALREAFSIIKDLR